MIQHLDQLRAQALRMSFRMWPRAEEIYRIRGLRLFLQFLIAVTVALPFAIYAPIVPLVVGPFIAGPAHLIASARVVSRSSSWLWLLATFIAAFASLLFSEHSLILLLLGSALFLRSWRAVVLAIALSLVAWQSLFWAALVAMFAHNFVGFYYWYRATNSNRTESTGSAKSHDRHAAVGALTLTLAISMAIAVGTFDHWLWLSPLNRFVPEDLLSVANIRWLTIFAFTQSIHYFVWLKAIPDQRTTPIPPSFRKRWSQFESSSGRAFALVSLAGAATLVVWSVTHLPSARIAYAAASSFHGWLEIAAIGLL